MNTYIVQLKDTDTEGFNLMATTQALSPEEALREIAIINEFDPGIITNYKVYKVEDLTNIFS